jgi:hypothetical protein
VAALVTLSANPVGTATTTPVTGQPIVLSGHVTPNHPYQPVYIQQQNSLAGNGWSTIVKTFTGPGSSFSVPQRWTRPGIYTLRAVFKGDARNSAADSDNVTVTIQQRQNPTFTINSSSPIITDGQSVTISGVLYKPGSAASPVPDPTSTEVTLYGKTSDGSRRALATTTTASDGAYSFSQTPIHNEAYVVQTTLRPKRETATLYEGVQDVVTINGSSYQTPTANESITLTGSVEPDHTGHLIYLQSESSDDTWHNVDTAVVGTGSTYSFLYMLAQDGTLQLRARIYGGPENVGAASPAVPVLVAGEAPTSSLPPAS